MNRDPLRTALAIVGAGQAAARTAQELRALGHVGPITLVGAETEAAYERPPLSKSVLQAGAQGPTPVLSESIWDELNIDFIAGTRVTGLNLQERRLELERRRTLAFERCLLATGGEVRTLPALPPGGPHTHYLRTFQDAQQLRQRLKAGGSLAVIGGGFLGLEAALSARQAGLSVTVIESAPTLLGRFMPPAMSQWLAQFLSERGITVHLGQALSSAHDTAEGVHLRLSEGTVIDSDAVLVAIGLQPQVELARQAGLALDPTDGGIVVAADGRTSHPDVFAAGDCASQYRPALGLHARLESWQNANEQARAAAAGRLGRSPPPPAYPWFWTDLGDQNVQMLGLKADDLTYVQRRPEPGRGLWLGLREGVAVHAVALNCGADLRALRPLLEQKIRVEAQVFSDSAIALRTWAKNQLAATAATHP